MNNVDIRSLYGLKYNPFLPDLPPEALYAIPGTESFGLRVRSMAENGGFALITGEPGLGKSKTLQKIAHQLEQIPDLTVGVMQRPQSKLGDFYREMGELFNVNLSPSNRYGGFKALRDRWERHCQSTLLKPVLLIINGKPPALPGDSQSLTIPGLYESLQSCEPFKLRQTRGLYD